MASENAKKAAEALESTINCMGNGEDMKYLVNEMTNLHRTLNQSLVGGFIIPFVKEMAKRRKEGWYDLRNQAACEMCEVMWDALAKKYELDFESGTRLPLI